MTSKLARLAGEYFLSENTLEELGAQELFWYDNVDVEDKDESRNLSRLWTDVYKASAVYIPNIGSGLILTTAAITNNANYLKALLISEGIRLGTKALNGLYSIIEGKQRKELIMSKTKIKELESELAERRGF